VYEKSGTIVAPIAAHMGNNLLSVLAGAFSISSVSVFELIVEAIVAAGMAWYLFFYKPAESRRKPVNSD
jgi:hypothetical protein